MKKLLSTVRRTTLLIRDLEKSTKFYMSVFGFSEYSDINVDLNRVKDFPVSEEHQNSRLRVLKGKDPLIGMLGLMEIQDPPLPEQKCDTKYLGIGGVAIVLATSDCRLSASLVEEYGGKILMLPTEGRNLGDFEGNFISVIMFMARDPDGYFLEVFEEVQC
jgi:predicted enzyme related to lactoylglutathione lyase